MNAIAIKFIYLFIYTKFNQSVLINKLFQNDIHLFKKTYI